MRLLTNLSLLSLALLAPRSALAQDAQDTQAGEGQATSRVLVYDDDDATTVVTKLVDVEATLPASVTLGAYAVLDSVSSASVDVISAATGRWQEDRLEVGARASVAVHGNVVSLGAVRSQENDWLSHTLSLATSREMFQRNTVVSAAYAFTSNQVGRSRDPNFKRSLDVHSAQLGVSQLLDTKTRGGLAYTFQYSSGYQASPYRFVSSSDGVAQAERHPETRQRHALSGFLLRSLAETMSARLGYRLYRDDWGIWSHTASLRFSTELSKYFSASLEGRYYFQNKANFYRGQYATSLRYMTADRELSTFSDLGGGAELAATLGPVALDAKISVIRYRFRNFLALPRRVAVLIGGGAKVQW